jgi:hypothetical protein
VHTTFLVHGMARGKVQTTFLDFVIEAGVVGGARPQIKLPGTAGVAADSTADSLRLAEGIHQP